MRWPWTTKRTGDGRPDTASSTAVTFTGFAEPSPDLYEFHTVDGSVIFLHEMECLRVAYDPIHLSLELVFECLESEVMDHPMTVHLLFEGAQILRWLTSGDSLPSPDGRPSQAGGQVSDLGRCGDVFHLSLLDVELEFSARIVTCRVRRGIDGEAHH
ncbi:hypothetical protein [Tessaracoccus flavescens]|uniref:hypothetical protein n=1 Tax=Tessaracoccus flavescens TaxID=399497 RepID=UPI0012601C34|nr:hypothetical protein [Tessaracoccus flavescens]